MTTPEEVRAALAVRLRSIALLKSAHEYEPETLGELPATTLLFARLEPREAATGPRLDVTWHWELRLYVGLSDWAASQAQLEELVWSVLPLWRDDPTLDHLVEWWRIEDTGEPPVFDADRRWMRKSLDLSAVIENVPLPA